NSPPISPIASQRTNCATTEYRRYENRSSALNPGNTIVLSALRSGPGGSSNVGIAASATDTPMTVAAPPQTVAYQPPMRGAAACAIIHPASTSAHETTTISRYIPPRSEIVSSSPIAGGLAGYFRNGNT